MRYAIAALAGLAFGCAVIAPVVTPAVAGPREDAEAVVDKLITQKMMRAILRSMAPLMQRALRGSLSRGPGRNLSDDAGRVVIELFMTSFQKKFMSRMRQQYVEIYERTLSSSELSGLRAFLDTPAGQGFAEKQSVLISKGSAAGRRVGGALGVEVGRDIGRMLAEQGGLLIPDAADREILRKLFPAP